jgi:glycosyltransferase involved in cell wall biosynthesis
MRIALDAKRLLNNPTGLGNHARILLNALMRDYADNDYLLFSPRAKDEFFHQLHGDFEVHFPETKWAQSIHPWWRSYGITHDLLRNRADLYHGISNELPFNIHRSGIATVVTIHDLIFRKHTEQYPWIDRQTYTLKTKYAAKYADAIIAVSRETKQDLIEMYQVPERKIKVIYPSVDRSFYHPVADAQKAVISERYKLPKKYILNVGSFFPRKNQIKLIEAFDGIKDAIAEDLVLVGSSGNMLAEIQKIVVERKLNDRVHIITEISNDDLPAVYQLASLFVFPSLFEGFGAPVLEALFSGLPVIASGGGAIAEAAGSDSGLIDPTSREDMADKILTVLKDERLRERMTAVGHLHAQTMTDSVFAAETMDVYRRVL